MYVGSVHDLMKLPSGESSKNKLLYRYKKRAKKLKLDWTLTDEQCEKLFDSPCYYCDTVKYSSIKNTGHSTPFEYNGIDRVDNSRGYSSDNVVPCCGRCNSAKNKFTLGEFEDWVIKVYNHRFKDKTDEEEAICLV